MIFRGLAATLGVCLAINAAWLVKAGDEIHRGYHRDPFSELLRHVDDNRTTDFALSPRIRRRLARIGALDRPNLVSAAETGRSQSPALGVVQWRDLAESSGSDLCLVTANRPGANTWPDPAYEVNRDYYPTFPSDRVVIVPSEAARKMRSFGGSAERRQARESDPVGAFDD